METRKEDLAKVIARNMASTGGYDDSPSFAVGVTDFGEDGFDEGFYGASEGAVRAAPRKKASGSRTSSGRKKSSGGTKKSSAGSGKKKASGKRSSSAKSTGKKKKKKKKMSATKVALICTCIVVMGLAGAGGVYIMGRKAYDDAFLSNTYIGGVDVGGMDKKQAISELKKKSVIPETVYITKKDGTGLNIKLADIGYVDNTEKAIDDLYNGQDHGKWIGAMFDKEEYTIADSFSYDKKLLEKELAHKLLRDQKAVAPKDAYITRLDNGSFSVVNEVDGDTIDENKIQLVYDYVEKELDKMNFDIAIGSVDCYKTAKVKADELYEDCTKLNNLHNIQITIDFVNDTELIDGNQVMEWTDFDEDAPVSNLEVDRDAVERYVDSLAEKYDTFGKDREFQSTNRGLITVPQGQGCYGWWLDKKGMTNYIINAIEECESVRTDAIWYVNPDSTYSYTCNPDWLSGGKDFSDTYFDVDLSAQHLWYYEDGKVKMESDFVSGYPSESRNTPAGVYKLWLKERGKTLVGSSDGVSYASYVEFWNYISTIGIGFHDASWQGGVFGGTKYQSSTWGSHGCINLPYDAAEFIYNNVEYDTPVFAYW
ncbi:L,D-transpeptidase family protein [Ruminococcus sp.]|uniref:L,D-transpeptidase family protein n=1 Tax=Ruminococcus sp. TaxID=41978 RepID=UPI0025D901A7|nr:L,D-transpeptidase family protein [Ruminococcus sp.]MBQ8968090.1 peptidoglycan binding domain-containing protein [Ruminococcus sp.]